MFLLITSEERYPLFFTVVEFAICGMRDFAGWFDDFVVVLFLRNPDFFLVSLAVFSGVFSLSCFFFFYSLKEGEEVVRPARSTRNMGVVLRRAELL